MRKDSFFISLVLCLIFVVSGLYDSLLIGTLQKNLPVLEPSTAPGSFLLFLVLWALIYLVIAAIERLASVLEKPPAKKEDKAPKNQGA